jgi:hypothetical protein
MRERRDRTSPSLLAGNFEEFDQAKGILTAFAEMFIVEECLLAGKMVDRENMERKLLKKFMLTRGGMNPWRCALIMGMLGGSILSPGLGRSSLIPKLRF